MSIIPETLFGLSIGLLLYTYVGFGAFLALLTRIIRRKEIYNKQTEYMPDISVIVSAYNEEKVIAKRIRNLFDLRYPKEKLEIIIASDGSSDSTVDVAKKYEEYGIKVLDFKQNRGKAAIQNDSVKSARGEIIVFTDAETEFEKDSLKKMVRPFSNDLIGCVVGNLIYNTERTSVSESEGLYWRFEKKLREFESNLGILATATGACMAVRRRLWRDLAPIDDSDFTTPLDVIRQGYKIVYVPDAIAYDVPPHTIKGELKTRIRQTSKNFVGTLRRWGWKGWIKHPIISWGLLSHKILRWFTPFFMLGAFISNLFLFDEGMVYLVVFFGQIIFFILAILGLAGELLKRRIVIASTVFSFCVANIGMGIGIIKGLLGKAPASFKDK